MVISSPLAGTRAGRRASVRSISAISPATLRSEFDVKVPARELMKIDALEHIETLMELGSTYARVTLKPEHVAGFK
jgi:hypothetical protein